MSKSGTLGFLTEEEVERQPASRKRGIVQRKVRGYVGRQERAHKLVDELRVKQHLFLPSKRAIWTVVGRDGDTMVNFGAVNGSPYCSCNDFHFRVLGGEIAECYHLIAARRARDQGIYSITNFSDEEYESFLRSLMVDVFSRI